MNRIVVYGTLKTGTRKTDFVKGYLYDLGAYPAIILDKNGTLIEVEIAQVDDVMLQYFDVYEGYHGKNNSKNLYNRVKTKTTNGNTVYIYEFANKKLLKEKVSPMIPSQNSKVVSWKNTKMLWEVM